MIRHTAVHVERDTCYGQSDVVLKDTFLAESQEMKKKLPDLKNAFFYSSPLTRCRNLVNQIVQSDKVIFDNRLLELNFGDWELLKWDEIDQPLLQTWMDNFVECPCPNGESFQQMALRVNIFLADIVNQDVDQVVVFTHAGVIRCIISEVLGMPLKNAFRLQVDFGSITKLNVVDKLFKLSYLNL